MRAALRISIIIACGAAVYGALAGLRAYQDRMIANPTPFYRMLEDHLFGSLCIAFGILMFSYTYFCLRRGAATGKFSRYERGQQPAHFWFYIAFYITIGAAACGYGALLLQGVTK